MELMIRNVRWRSAMKKEKKHFANARQRRKSECKVAPVFAIYSASKQTRPWSSFHDGNTLDIHLTIQLLLLLLFCFVSSPFIIKIANLAEFFYPKDEFPHLKLLQSHPQPI